MLLNALNQLEIECSWLLLAAVGMTYDSMNGVQGPYAVRIFETELRCAHGTAKNAEPLPDFGGPSSPWHGHADPNLTYAVELVRDMGLNKEGHKVDTGKPIPCFGAAADGDADRPLAIEIFFNAYIGLSRS